jgi:hypothetical protein
MAHLLYMFESSAGGGFLKQNVTFHWFTWLMKCYVLFDMLHAVGAAGMCAPE